ncbi:MAG: ABC transporter permease [Proteobacteria bacterium]|nr:ABC transporter permease [Pseudomonadota bacterium]
MTGRAGPAGNQSNARALMTLGLLAPALLFLITWFLWPLMQLLMLSFSAPAGAFSAYVSLMESAVFRAVFVNTLQLALFVTVICTLLAYPAAWLLTRVQGFWFSLALYCVLVPFWISVLVRTFSWMLLLERNGPVNSFLMKIGATDQPLRLLFNDFGVYLGMVHVLLPYAILPVYAAMLKVDPRLLQASDGLGASGRATFFRVFLPLTLPGVWAGAAFVFLLALGFFITPALLGGPRNLTAAMLIDSFVNERLVWPMAAAASFILLFIVLAVLLVVSRFVALGSMVTTK